MVRATGFFWWRMLVFLGLCALVMVVLYKQIALPLCQSRLNALTRRLLLSASSCRRQVIRLYPEVGLGP